MRILNTAQRLATIIDLITRKGSISIKELEELFPVSHMTIHRDLVRLEREGILRRVKGGAILSKSTTAELTFSLREQRNKEKKFLIGSKAVDLVEDGTAIAVDASTTALHFIRSLKRKQFSNLIVVTTGIKAALELVGEHGIQVILCGGMVREVSLSVVGKLTSLALKEFHCVKAFISGEGLTFENGLTASNMLEVESKQALIESASESILLLDSSKFGKTAFITIAPIEAFSTIITDSSIPEDFRTKIIERKIQLIIAEK
ncbi:MAG: DeoR/GlpR family DNA-binding transcription regulator [bacterium]|nr:DeoR/GlpR family DNA-binding transcription regulator [bacterium]